MSWLLQTALLKTYGVHVLMMGILTSVRWVRHCNLICILIISNVEHLFHVPTGYLHFFFGEMSRYSIHFLIGLFGFSVAVIELYELFRN